MSLIDLFFHASCMQNEKDIAEFGKQYYYYISSTVINNEINSLDKGIQFAKYVRNIHEGKGIQILFYEMVYQLSRVCIIRTNALLETLPSEVGSWKDFKKIAQYMYSKTKNTQHPVIQQIIIIINRQLADEMEKIKYCSEANSIELSNVSKWVPREGRCFWLFYALAFHWAANYDSKLSRWILLKQPLTKKIENKICMCYRNIVSELNRRNKTVEIYLCSREYQYIHPRDVPLLAFNKYKRLFLDYYHINPDENDGRLAEEINSEIDDSNSKSFSKMTYDFKVHLNKFFSFQLTPDKKGGGGVGGGGNDGIGFSLGEIGMGGVGSGSGCTTVRVGSEILKDPINIRLGSLVKEAVQLLEKKMEKNYLDLFSGEKTSNINSNINIPMKIIKKFEIDVVDRCHNMLESGFNRIVDTPVQNKMSTPTPKPTPKPNKMDILFSKFMNLEYSINILNKQWEFFMKQCPPLDNFIPFLDVSLDMYSNNRQYLFDAIGIACAITNRSTIPNRIMTIDHIPNWIVLPEKDSVTNHEFVSIVKTIMESFSGNTIANLHKSFDLLALSFLNTGTKSHDITQTTIVIISNFIGFSKYENIHDSLTSIFIGRGIHAFPHIVYWNVGGGMDIVIPCTTDTVGASLQSGHALTDVCHLSYIDKTDTVKKNVENILSLAFS